MCSPVAAVTALVGGLNFLQGRSAARQQERAMRQSQEAAAAEATQQRTAFNRANRRKPNIEAYMARAAMAARGGVGSTMLTGPGGVATSALPLGRAATLGGA